MDSIFQSIGPLCPKHFWVVVLIVGFTVFTLLHSFMTGGRDRRIPLVTLKKKGLWAKLQPSYLDWIRHPKELLAQGKRDFSDSLFQISTASGYRTILPNHFADEIRNNPNLSFSHASAKDFLITYPGFEGLRAGLQDETFIGEVIRTRLTQSLGLITKDLVEETFDSLHTTMGEDDQWHISLLKNDVLEIIARLSSRVFLGKELCRNEDWLKITKNYSVDTFKTATALRRIPALIRPVGYWFLPVTAKLRGEVRAARRLIMPEVERRRVRAEQALASGKPLTKAGDAISWMVEISRGRKVDYVAAQLCLSVLAIHTTSETTTSAILHLCDTPELVGLLRQEIIAALEENGWSQASLSKMKLMDSFLKESQRFSALSKVSMVRYVKKDVTLSNGQVVRAGTQLMVRRDKAFDESAFPDPFKLDPERFLKLRSKPGEQNRHQFVTTSAEHMGFGLGQHACPGRFFASNEIKIMLCFLLLYYDFRYIPGAPKPKHLEVERLIVVNPGTTIQIRRRKEEINLMELLVDH